MKDSTEFTIDKDVTCLVGKNEAGKTAILEALSKIDPVDERDKGFDVTHHYPRHEVDEYRQGHAKNPATAVTTVWELEEDDLNAIEALVGPAARKMGQVKVHRKYDNSVYIEFDLDESAVIQHFLKSAEMSTQEKSALKGASSIQDLSKQLAANTEVASARSALAASLKQKFKDGSARDAVSHEIWNRVPKFAFFSQYLRMPGQLSADAFMKRVEQGQLTEEDKVFTSLLSMIGMSVEEFSKISNTEELYARLESTSNKLTAELVRYWSQGEHLKMIFDFKEALANDPPPFNSGRILRTRIQNTRHGATTSFDQRSSGFVWFFSFLVWFNQLKKNVSDNLVILLDEPGLALHASAQADLLRYIKERLAPHYQVIYSTHSPFMLDPGNLLQARTVEDVYRLPSGDESPDLDPHRGTKVSDQVLRAERSTLFPLRACLGYELTQTLFVGQHNLLVEGPSDLLYIDWYSRKLKSLGRAGLDARWTVVPCGSLSKVSAFMNLFGGNDLHCAVVCDFADGGKKEVRALQDSELLRADHIFTMDRIAGKQQADIEDLLGDEGYVSLVNSAYALAGDRAVALPVSGKGSADGRILKHVESAFPVLGSNVADFSHMAPADWLVKQGVGYVLPGEKEALNRFEGLFKALNALL